MARDRIPAKLFDGGSFILAFSDVVGRMGCALKEMFVVLMLAPLEVVLPLALVWRRLAFISFAL